MTTRTPDPRPSRSDWTDRKLPLEIEASEETEDTKGSSGGSIARILTTDASSQHQLAVLITDEERAIRLNGVVPLTVAVLGDKDEIQVGERVYLFAAFQGSDYEGVADGSKPLKCARCTRPIEPPERTVRCPACPALFHLDPPLEADGSRSGPSCKAYDPICKDCGRSWASMSWRPEEIYGA